MDVLPALVEALREALHAERGLAYGVDIGPERYQVSYLHIAGFPTMTRDAAHAYLDGFVGTRRDSWGYFNPACPQPSQRNRELQFQAPGTDAAPASPAQGRAAHALEVARRPRGGAGTGAGPGGLQDSAPSSRAVGWSG